MKKMIGTLAAALALAVIGSAPYAAAADRCFYKGAMFSEGASTCQSGANYRCDDGDWKPLGVACKDEALTASKPCVFSGINYSTGSASCQEGRQFRCEDGTWQSIGTTCAVGDSPIRVTPLGARTCMYEGATVATNSTICRSQQTFLCSDGEWINLGTACR